MKTCKDCIHYECCSKLNSEFKKYPRDFIYSDLAVNNCNAFKDKSLVLDLPCKVGDTVYRIVYVYNGEPKIIEGEIFEFAITNESCKRLKHRFYFMAKGEDYIRRNYSYWGDFEDFGTFVFLTRESAEQALKGGVQE